tara:strand:- start:5205 stop:5450 length:246 start_codon:yes stop_codon:yes gene_type:complete
MKELLIESLVVGIITVVIGTLVSLLVSYFMKVDMPPVCKDWNKNNVMEICLFLTGVFAHLMFESIGANKWYCKNGVACKKN